MSPYNNLGENFISVDRGPDTAPPRITAQESNTWTHEAWTGNPSPYQNIKNKIDGALAGGQDPKTLVAPAKAAAEADPKNPQALFRWGYSQWRAITPPYGTGDKYINMTPVFKAMLKAPSPNTYDYARMRFLAAPYDAFLVSVGERLVRANAEDRDVKYHLTGDYEGLISIHGLRTHEVDEQAKKRALALAQGMAKAFPSTASYPSAIGGIYATCWTITHSRDDAAKAVEGYEAYLKLAPPDDEFRPQAAAIIKELQKS